MGGARHSGVGVRLITRLGLHVEANSLGGVYGPDATFKIGQNERLPDVAFVSASRIGSEGEPEGIWQIPPDLAVEILSPIDLFEKVISNVHEYFAAGVRQFGSFHQNTERSSCIARQRRSQYFPRTSIWSATIFC